MSVINSTSCTFCYIDLDFDHDRSKLATGAAFVDATDSRYGFSSKDLRLLGGSEVARIPDLIANDHEWSTKANVKVQPPSHGNRIVVKLYWDVAPLACENFATLCANGSILPNEKKARPVPIGESGKPLSYRGSNVHRVQTDFVIQAGDFIKGNGSGGESIYNGKKFKDERAGTLLKHDRKGVLSMGNSGKNSNSSQFFITLTATPQCDGKHVVFGEVVSGFEILHHAQTVGSSTGEPTVPVTITDCGVYAPLQTPGAGYWYDQPDAESYGGISPVFMVRPRVAVLAPSGQVLQKFIKAMGNFVSFTAIASDSLGGKEAVHTKMVELLDKYCVDVIVVAPSCRAMIDGIEVPPSWRAVDSSISIHQIILESKPVDTLAAVRSQSWLSTKAAWHLDGAHQ
jgi:cyclophilin family peptidyl-prolyl cis-trans isomerase